LGCFGHKGKKKKTEMILGLESILVTLPATNNCNHNYNHNYNHNHNLPNLNTAQNVQKLLACPLLFLKINTSDLKPQTATNSNKQQ